MYKCGICGAISRPRDPCIKLVRHKPGGKQIESETPICRACARQIEMGLTAADIRRSLAPAPAVLPVAVPTTKRVEI